MFSNYKGACNPLRKHKNLVWGFFMQLKNMCPKLTQMHRAWLILLMKARDQQENQAELFLDDVTASQLILEALYSA